MADALVGEQRRIFRTILDDGVETDPTTLTLEIERPDGTIDTFNLATLENPSVGFYYIDYLIPAPGKYDYRWTSTVPATVGEGSFTAAVSALEAVLPTTGPCEPWVSADDVAEYCGSQFSGGSDTSELEPYAAIASDVLFQISGGFTGECGPIVVRPCADSCGCWGKVLARVGTSPTSTIVWGSGYWNCGGRSCGCSPLSEVRLTGHPREIIEVKIDGTVLDPGDYRLDTQGRLVRVRDTADPDSALVWPGCQILDLPDTEAGTFSVEYTYGLDPPDAGREAAKALACQMYLARNNNGRCKLPQNTQSVIRGGLTIQLGGLVADSLKRGATGILAIDAFVAAYVRLDARGNPVEESTVWSPDIEAYPRRML